MLKTYLYIPEELNKRIKHIAKAQKSSKAEVIRNAIEKGLDEIPKSRAASINVLFKIAELGKQIKAKGPRDLAANMDKYLWDNHDK